MIIISNILTFNFPILNRSQNWRNIQLHQIQSQLRLCQKQNLLISNLIYWHICISSHICFLSQLCFKILDKLSYLSDTFFHQISYYSYSANSPAIGRQLKGLNHIFSVSRPVLSLLFIKIDSKKPWEDKVSVSVVSVPLKRFRSNWLPSDTMLCGSYIFYPPINL